MTKLILNRAPAPASAPLDPLTAIERALYGFTVGGQVIRPTHWFEGDNAAWMTGGRLIGRTGIDADAMAGYGLPVIGQKAGRNAMVFDGTRAMQAGNFTPGLFTLTFAFFVDASSPTSASTVFLGGAAAASFGVGMTGAGLVYVRRNSSTNWLNFSGDLRGAWRVATFIANEAAGTFSMRLNGVSAGALTGQTGFPTETNLQIGRFTALNADPAWALNNAAMLPPIIWNSAGLSSAQLLEAERYLGQKLGLGF